MDTWLERSPVWLQALAGLAVTAWYLFELVHPMWQTVGAIRHTSLRLTFEVEGYSEALRLRVTNRGELAVTLTRLCYRAGDTSKVLELPTSAAMPLTAQPGETMVVPFSVAEPEWFARSRCIMLKLAGGHTATVAIPEWLKRAKLSRAA
ncbi:MAG: hypothetical protein U0836_28045 [Pirellulales bacterium]